jgi:viroplasmin and RNaseH domain-containing protein
MITGDFLIEQNQNSPRSSNSSDFLSKIFGDSSSSPSPNSSQIELQPTEAPKSSESELEKKRFKKPAFDVPRPQNTFISIDQALEYSGDNSTYSKRCLYILMLSW